MRLRYALGLIAAVLVTAGLISGFYAALLGFTYAIPVVLTMVVAAKRSDPPGYVHLNLVLWTITGPVALLGGLAWHGWVGAVVFVFVAVVLNSIATRAIRGHSR